MHDSLESPAITENSRLISRPSGTLKKANETEICASKEAEGDEKCLSSATCTASTKHLHSQGD